MKNYQDLNDYELVYLVSENNEDAHEILLKKYYKLISIVVGKYYNSLKKYGIEKEDLIQEGYIGLLNAIKTFTEDKNCLFYTYAMFLIDGKIKNFIKKNSTYANKSLNESISLYTPVSDKCDTEMIDLIEDSKEILPEIESDRNILYEQLNKFLFVLPFRYSIVLELRINGFSYNDVSKLLDIEIKNVTNIMNKVRKKIYSLKKYF